MCHVTWIGLATWPDMNRGQYCTQYATWISEWLCRKPWRSTIVNKLNWKESAEKRINDRQIDIGFTNKCKLYWLHRQWVRRHNTDDGVTVLISTHTWYPTTCSELVKVIYFWVMFSHTASACQQISWAKDIVSGPEDRWLFSSVLGHLRRPSFLAVFPWCRSRCIWSGLCNTCWTAGSRRIRYIACRFG